MVPELAAAGLDAISVSLNAADAATYARVCPSRYGESGLPRGEGLHPAAPAPPSPRSRRAAWRSRGSPRRTAAGSAEGLGARFRWRPYDRLGRVDGVG